ncbi:trans-2,3-enoyl-CoA reductase-like [Megalops cyprinoides]|uniref:trans-2,3-enoyl-CoA reductase-like n=1 Tax=Megalops cyprinoides TaxID=118141 RepID=UPI001864A61B|nr:trans-2,3-enoyl-CoA reductase-like [Megalops cyprinoides]
MSPARRDPSQTFFSFSQLILNSGALGLQVNRAKVSYIEVEILDHQTGRPVSIIDKVHPLSTVLDLKNRFHKACPGWYPSRTGLRTVPNGPFLPDTCVMQTIATSSLVSVYSTDLGRQVGWSAVFLTQYVGPILIYLMFYLRLSNVYDDTVKSQRPPVVHLACFCHSLHYIKHVLETLFVHRLSDGYTPLRNLLKGCAFYWGFTAWLGYYINHPLYTPPYFENKQVIPSLVWFLVCEAGNFCINIALARHNQTVKASYPRPTYNPFTWLFKLVHCPQYTYEIGAWLSLAVMTQTLPVAVFAMLISIQMLLWAKKRHHKYLRQRRSSSGYRRAAVIPFIL